MASPARHLREVRNGIDVLARGPLRRDGVTGPRAGRGKPGHFAGRISLIGLLPLRDLVIGRRGAGAGHDAAIRCSRKATLLRSVALSSPRSSISFWLFSKSA